MLEFVLFAVGFVLVIYLAFLAKIIIVGNRYHAMVRQAVIAELGVSALPYLTAQPIIEQITSSYRRGYPTVATASALVLLIRLQLEGDNDV